MSRNLLSWDSRLDELNVKQVPASQPTFRLVEAYFQDAKDPNDPQESESKLGIKIMVGVEDARGRALTNVKVIQKWPDDQAYALTNPTGYVDFDMSGDSSFDPKKGQSGPYQIFIQGGDKVTGLGL